VSAFHFESGLEEVDVGLDVHDFIYHELAELLFKSGLQNFQCLGSAFTKLPDFLRLNPVFWMSRYLTRILDAVSR
jgi:hypothetical protein